MTSKDEARERAWATYEYRDGCLYSTTFQDGFDAGVAYAEGQCAEQIAAAVIAERLAIADKLSEARGTIEWHQTMVKTIDELRGER